jgi:hypothetical protein
MPNTIKKSSTISNTFKRAGIDKIRELTTVLIPSFFDTTLRGLSALSALKPLMKEILVSPAMASRIQVKKEN